MRRIWLGQGLDAVIGAQVLEATQLGHCQVAFRGVRLLIARAENGGPHPALAAATKSFSTKCLHAKGK